MKLSSMALTMFIFCILILCAGIVSGVTAVCILYWIYYMHCVLLFMIEWEDEDYYLEYMIRVRV